MRVIDEATKQAVISLYQEGKPYSEIEEKTGCASMTIINIARAAGLPGRKRANLTRHCDCCGSDVKIKDVRFCPFCGKSMLTKKEKLIADIRSLYQHQSLMNERSRDEYKERIDNIIEQLKKARLNNESI